MLITKNWLFNFLHIHSIIYLYHSKEANLKWKLKNFGENKIRIILDINDLAEKNIDFHEFMSNPIDSQSLFLDMLDQAEKEIGFVTKDCKIMIEALAMSNGSFVLTVTRVLPDADKINNTPRKKIKVKRKINTILSASCAIFEFSSFDNFYDYGCSLSAHFCDLINKNIGLSKLYLYNSKYYLIVEKVKEDANFIKSFSSSISEFGRLVSNSNTYKNKIIEHGKLVLKKNAIFACSTGFKK